MFCTFVVVQYFRVGVKPNDIKFGPYRPIHLDQNLNSRTSSAESGVVTVAELTFNSAELRNVEVVACVCGYSQSPISSFPISLLNAF